MFHLMISLLCLFWAANLQDPQLLRFRIYDSPSLILAACAGLVLILLSRSEQPLLRRIIAAVWVSCAAVTSYSEYALHAQKQTVQMADGEFARQLRIIGQHLVIGYENPEQIRTLVQRGFVGGVYVGRRNAMGKTAEDLRAEIAGLQTLRREAGLPPLIIAADQEGGSVAHLSPPLPQQNALATIASIELPDEELQQLAFSYGVEQAKALGSVGVNVNLSPVVDLKPQDPASRLDFHTQIAKRAIAGDPEKVTSIALAYSEGLFAAGITPTLKHFPGLGSVPEDSHHFRARLKTPLDDLKARDWQPFKTIASNLPVFLMVGHIVVDQLDADLPASQSQKVITNLLRKEWQFNGVIITDDMTMAAAYDTGLCSASINSLNAGVDILLLSYDWEKVYPAMTCLQKAYASGKLKNIVASNLRVQSFYASTNLDKSRTLAMEQ